MFAIDFVCRIESQPFTYDLVASVSILYGVTVNQCVICPEVTLWDIKIEELCCRLISQNYQLV